MVLLPEYFFQILADNISYVLNLFLSSPIVLLALHPYHRPGIDIERTTRVQGGVGTPIETITVPEIVSMMIEGMMIARGGGIIVERVLRIEAHAK